MLRLPALLGAALLFALSAPAAAGPTSTWSVDSYKEFDKGEGKATLISSTGEVRPGFDTKKTSVEFTDSWSMVRGRGGESYIGTANDGAVYRFRGGKASKFATLKGVVAVVSLAQAGDGTLYAGTMPGGQVWKITPGGKASKLATLKDAESVWALTVAGNSVFAGTGPKGQLFRIDRRSGKATVAFKTEDKRITALMTAKDGSVWLGTSDKAMVFRHDPKRKTTRAMADFAGNEISAIAEHNGAALVAANDLKEPTTAGVKTKSAIDRAAKRKKEGIKVKTPKTGSKPGAEATKVGTEPMRKGARKGKGALFRVRGDGALTQLHALTSTYFTSIAVDGDGRIYAGAADKGRIYLIEDDDAVSTAFDVDQRLIAQVTYHPKGGLLFATGDATALYQAAGAAGKSEYLSDTFDAKTAARFGTLVWHGNAISVETRTGNTADPGKGWSKWKAPRKSAPSPGGTTRGKVASPPGRYLQYRVKFKTGKAVLNQTKLYYLAQNKPTQVESIEIKASENKKLKTVQAKLKPRSPILEIKWKVGNDDGDETVYELKVRREGEARWRRLTPKDQPLTTTSYKWNTETYPDGYYRLRVVASDRRANPGSSRRETQKTTSLFAVDNQKPTIDGLGVRYPAASARARDSLSAIAEAAFSIDDGPWQVIGTADGLFDDQAELLQLSLPRGLSRGVHTLAIRVADEAGNIGTTSVSFRVP
ncbi:MAG: hypothetical protein KJO07_06660 [Deltaproteobacteria bacterium]|nr:hypothetical protein [Deltaproteobacteria bacterium]